MSLDHAPARLRQMPTWLLMKAALEGRRIVTEALASQEVHKANYALLASIEEFGACSQAELSARSWMDRSDAVRCIDELEQQGLVERTRDPGDRRRNVVSLTATGRTKLTELDRALRDAQETLLAPLAPAEREQLTDLLRRLIRLEDAGSMAENCAALPPD